MSDFSTILKNRFIGRTYKSSLGFDKSTFYENNSWSYKYSYSKYYSSSSKDREKTKDLLRTAYKSVHDSIVILDFPFKIDISFSATKFFSVSRLNKVILFIPTDILDIDDSSLSTRERLDYLCGTGIHEASHLKFTELRTVNQYYKTLGVCDKSSKKTARFRISEAIFNILEDERVENRLLSERPGYEIYIKNLKDVDYSISKFFKYKFSDNFINIFKEICTYIRFRSKFNVDEIKLGSNVYDEIDKFIEPIYNDFSVNTKTICQITDNLVDYILNISFTTFDPTSFEESYQKLLYGESYEFDFFRNIVIGKDETAGFSDYTTNSLPKHVTRSLDDDELDNLCGVLAGDIVELPDRVFLRKAESGNKDRYQEIKNRVSPYTAALRKILLSKNQNYDFNLQGCRSGLLDTTKLAEAYQGDPHVYLRQGHVRTSSVAICVLVDESGSMDYRDRDKIARETAILLNEAFSNLPGVELFIYGHTADTNAEGDTDLTLYKDPSIKDASGLVYIRARQENRDGQAILSCAKEVRKKTKSHCIMFVISDGSPCACNYYGASANRDTRTKIEKVRKTMDMDVIGILIEAYSDSKSIYGEDLIDFSHDLRSFSNNLAKLVTKVALNKKNTSVSYT